MAILWLIKRLGLHTISVGACGVLCARSSKGHFIVMLVVVVGGDGCGIIIEIDCSRASAINVRIAWSEKLFYKRSLSFPEFFPLPQ